MKLGCGPKNENQLASIVIATIILSLNLPTATAALQDVSLTAQKTVSGTVTELLKYSFRIQSGEETIEISSGPATKYRQRIFRPTFDIENNKILCEVVASGTKATDNKNLSVEIEVQPPLYIHSWFRHETEMMRCWESGGQKRLVNYVLTADAPTEPWLPEPGRLDLAGKIEKIDGRSMATIDFDELQIQALLLDRDASLDGGSIVDLKPFETEIEAKIKKEGDKWVAEEIWFTRLLDPLETETEGLPRCLILGDEMSLATLGPLRNNHDDIANYWHPPENCRGGESQHRLPVWLGPYKSPGRQWDVIVFNFGQANLDASDESYAEMLKGWTGALSKTGAKLVWVQTVPRTPSRSMAEMDQMKRLNSVATRFFSAYPDVTICDPAKDTEPDEMKNMEPVFWWARSARLIAESIVETLKKNKSDQ